MIQFDPAFIDKLADAIVGRIADQIRPEPIDQQLLVDGNRLAELLSISRPTVDRWVRDGRIPSILVKRRRLFRPDAVVKALEAAQ
jgi:excisionase family DNA binding protein